MQLATDAKLAVAKRRLSELKRWRFDSPLGQFGGIAWETDPRKRIKQILFLPLGLVAVLVLALLVPLAYLAHILEIHKARRALKQQILALCSSAISKAPSSKTLEELWYQCGLDYGSALSTEERLELLAKWLVVLYGETRASAINLETRVTAIGQRRVAANMPYYEGKEAPHFHFSPPIESLVRELSHELPHYNIENPPSQPNIELGL